jgi:hypothetical protein
VEVGGKGEVREVASPMPQFSQFWAPKVNTLVRFFFSIFTLSSSIFSLLVFVIFLDNLFLLFGDLLIGFFLLLDPG